MSMLAPSARLVGNRISRKEDPRLLTGPGRYVDDVVVPGMLHVAFARSDIARGRIVGVDVAAAREAEGVVAVLTAVDLNHVLVGPMGATPVLSMGPPGPYKVLADDEVRYVGDPYALVVAREPGAGRGCARADRARRRATPRCRRLHDRAREPGARASRYGSNVAGAMPMPPDDELRAIFESAPHVVTEHLRAEPLSGGADGDSRDRGLVAAANGFVRRVRVHPVAARRAHRHQPHHRRAREPDPGADGRRRRRLRPEGLPRARRADRVARQLPPGPTAQVDRRSPREPARGDVVTRRTLHGHNRGRRRGDDPRDRGRPPRRGRRVPDGRQRGRHGRGHLHRAVPHPEARVRVAVGVHEHVLARARTAGPGSSRPTSASRRSTASPVSWASTRSSCAAATCCSATSSRTRCRSASRCSTCRPPRRSSRPRRWSTTTRSASWQREQFARRTPPGRRHRPVHRAAEHDRAVQHRTRAHPHPTRWHRRRVPRLRIARARSRDDDRATRERVPRCRRSTTYRAPGRHQRDARTRSGPAAVGAVRSSVPRSRAPPSASDRRWPRSRPISWRPRPKTSTSSTASRACAAHPRDPAPSPRSRTSRTSTLGSLPPGMEPGLEILHRYKSDLPFVFSNACHLCTVEIDPHTGVVTLLRYIVSEDCGVMINPSVVEGQIAGGAVQGIGGALLEDFVYDEHGQPAHQHVHGLPASHRGRRARDRVRPHRDAGVDARPLQGGRRGRRDRSARPRWPTR